jgi:hypothetical protein
MRASAKFANPLADGVSVNTSSGDYQCCGTLWFDVPCEARFASEREALQLRRAAGGRWC